MSKILLLSIVYSPRQKNIYTDLVEELVKNNHSVTVISSCSNTVQVTNNYKVIGFDGSIVGKRNLIKKGIDTILIGKRFINIINKELSDEEFDLVLYATPPITLNKPVKYAKKIFKCKSYLMLKDIFPQNAVDLEMFKKFNPLYWYFRFKEKQLYRISDYIGCMSQGNIEYLLKHNSFIYRSKVGLFYNSISINKDHIAHEQKSNHNETCFIFGGNLGKPQNIDGLLKIINELRDYPLAKFVIMGKGANDYLIKNYIKNNIVSNLEYHDFVPKEEYDMLLEKSDVGMISLDPRFTIPNIPSKMPSYMNMKKPILAITDTNTDLKDIIQGSNSGWWCDANDISSVINTIKYICEHKDEQKVKGADGYKYLCENYDVRINAKQLEEFMGVNKNESI